MAAPKFIKLIAGVLTEVFSIGSTAGVGDVDKVVSTDGTTGRLDPSFMPGGVPVNTSGGAGDVGKLPKLDAAGALAANFMPGGTPVNTTAGAGDAGKLPKLDAAGLIAAAMMPGGAPIASSAGIGSAGILPKLDAAGLIAANMMAGGAPVNATAGSGDAGKLPKLDSNGKLDTSFMPTGLVADTLSVIAFENLSAGNLVNVYSNAGTLNVRKADATTAGKAADGFVLASVTAPAPALVYFDGQITGLTGLTVGADYFLDKTAAGGVVATPPASAGNIAQRVGFAVSATILSFQQGEPITLA